MSNQKVWTAVIGGYRLPNPPNCPEQVYEVMLACWAAEPTARPALGDLCRSFRTKEQFLRLELRRAKSYRMPAYIQDDTPVEEHIYVDFTNGTDVTPPLIDTTQQWSKKIDEVGGSRLSNVFEFARRKRSSPLLRNAMYLPTPASLAPLVEYPEDDFALFA
jgi:hypothetical protein